jgi:preprotein translocase subunit SecG
LTRSRQDATFPCYDFTLSREEKQVFVLLLTLLILDGLFLIVIILMQQGKGGGLAAMGGGAAGTDTLLGGGRQAASILTKATWTTGAIFVGLSVVLSIMSSRDIREGPLLEELQQQQAPVAPQPIVPGAGDAPVDILPEAGGPGTQDDGGP